MKKDNIRARFWKSRAYMKAKGREKTERTTIQAPDLVNRIIHLGTVRWFGGYNSKAGGTYCNYGYLNKHIIFRAWGFDTRRTEYYIRNSLRNCPAFFCLINDDAGAEKADWVKLVSEITEEELVYLYNHNVSLKKILDNSDNFLRLLKYPVLKAILPDVIRSMGVKKLMSLYQKKPNLRASLLRDIVSGVSWDELAIEDAIEFFTALSRFHSERIKILRDTFPRWMAFETVVYSLMPEDFPGCIPEVIEEQDVCALKELLLKVPDLDLKWKIRDYLLQREYGNGDDERVSANTSCS